MLASWFAWCYQHVFKPVAFRCDPEWVHNRVIQFGHRLSNWWLTRWLLAAVFRYQHPILEQRLNNITFVNPVGLAAGFDKDGRIHGLTSCIGFGFAEVGTVTAGAYEGNSGRRLLRLPKSKGIVVNYGLKSEGVQRVIQRLQVTPKQGVQIISIGRTNQPYTASCAAGIEDYHQAMQACAQAHIGDIYELNISCPNTSGGEPYTTPSLLDQLLTAVDVRHNQKPVWLKMPINLPWVSFQPLLDVAMQHGVQAVVIGNLNKNRHDASILDPIPSGQSGAVSGKPTWHLSNQLIARTFQYCGERLMIVGVGGIFSAADAYEKIQYGASLVELITGMIFQGPQLVGQINRQLVAYLQRDGFSTVQAAVGVKAHTL